MGLHNAYTFVHMNNRAINDSKNLNQGLFVWKCLNNQPKIFLIDFLQKQIIERNYLQNKHHVHVRITQLPNQALTSENLGLNNYNNNLLQSGSDLGVSISSQQNPGELGISCI